jgi:FkbM family methyltransferase
VKLDSARWWHPNHVGGTGAYIRRAAELAAYLDARELLIPHLDGRVAVQAGGHVGVVPALLAARFDLVYTFEPDAENFDCLIWNLTGTSNVYAARGALGDGYPAELVRHSKSSGGHCTRPGGPVPCYRIDELRLPRVDTIILDTEGSELEILKAGVKTIRRCCPLIVAEENRQMNKYGRKPGDLEQFLAPLGYRRVAEVGEDIVLEAS